ncbi:MAG TPA: S53 family peptidase [Candidatus Micrarchaeaceae archaeon]|nr:S53 family peptidase [Candidatus Micrarchaeaceae archaeon]
MPRPLITDYTQVSSTLVPPSEATCNGIGRRCWAPAPFQSAYNLTSLYTAGNQGQGVTVAVIDSFGSQTIAADLNNFSTQFGLPHLCGEANYKCAPGDSTFKVLCVQACTNAKSQPPTANDPGQENKSAWSVEVSLDVEWVHAVAPRANVLLVTVPTAETLGVQGFPLMMNAEQYVIDHGLAQVITQSFGAAEESFNGGTAALQNLRGAFVSAKAHNVSVFASSGDGGNENVMKSPVGGPNAGPAIPFPTVIWPGSDPLVTSVGGTYLCANANTTGSRTDDSVSPPAKCQANPGVTEIGWVVGGGGFSHVFGKPAYQNNLPSGSNTAGNTNNMRGVPDVSMEASSLTGVLVYDGGSWFVVGGTSVSSPTFAAVAAIADQVNGAPLGFLNDGLYKIGSNPARYANDFFDVTTGNNDQFKSPQDPNYAASTGWDPVTGLGTPNAANLVPDLILAVHGS